jgi:hypothetical protein
LNEAGKRSLSSLRLNGQQGRDHTAGREQDASCGVYPLEGYYPPVRSDREQPAATTARPVAIWERRTTK